MNFTLPWTAKNGHQNGVTDKLEDVRNALGREADRLTQVATQMGHEAGTHAETVARDVAGDAQKQTGAAINRLAEIAATVGPTIAVMGRQKMRHVGEQAQALGHDLRQVRVTTEPRRSGPDARGGIALLGGLGIGVALMYLLDPERGKDRRTALMAKLAQWTRDGRQVASEKANVLAERTVSVVSDVRESVTTAIGKDEPLIAEELSYETWPEGTRVPTEDTRVPTV